VTSFFHSSLPDSATHCFLPLQSLVLPVGPESLARTRQKHVSRYFHHPTLRGLGSRKAVLASHWRVSGFNLSFGTESCLWYVAFNLSFGSNLRTKLSRRNELEGRVAWAQLVMSGGAQVGGHVPKLKLKPRLRSKAPLQLEVASVPTLRCGESFDRARVTATAWDRATWKAALASLTHWGVGSRP
jgi:hypothetical protein